MNFPWPCRLLLKVHQEICSNHKTPYSSYTSWHKIQLGTRSPNSINQPEGHSDTSTHTMLPRPFELIHSLHRCFRWCYPWCNVKDDVNEYSPSKTFNLIVVKLFVVLNYHRNTMTKNYQSHFSYTHSQTPSKNGPPPTERPIVSIMP